MKILELPQFENIERMSRKEIVALVKPLIEKAPNRAHELRLNLAIRSGRTVKSLVKMLGRVDTLAKYDVSEYDVSEYDGTEIGDKVQYVDTRQSGRGCYTMTSKTGTVWAISGKSAIVTHGSGLATLSLEKESA